MMQVGKITALFFKIANGLITGGAVRERASFLIQNSYTKKP